MSLLTCCEVKGTHTVYLCSSFYIINQKPMIPTTDFHCITICGCTFFVVNYANAFACFWFHVY